MTDTDWYIKRLEESNPLRVPVLRKALKALDLPAGSHGLDAGCGIGLQAILLAELIEPGGHVTGLDRSPDFLANAEDRIFRAGKKDTISFIQGDVGKLPFEDDAFDWVWSSDCVGYPVGHLFPVLDELKRVVKPGGNVAVLAWSSQRLLPGYPLLEDRLNATCSCLIPIVSGSKPDDHFMRALDVFHEAGMEKVTGNTFVGDVQAPLDCGVRDALISLFDMLWDRRQPDVSPEDWEAFTRLCRPDSPDCIVDLADYYAFFTYTMFYGVVPQ